MNETSTPIQEKPPLGRYLARLRDVARTNPKEWFANWLTAALVLRLVLMALPIGFFIDINSFQAWALRLAEKGPTHFYESIWSDYPPGYMYVLWIVGQVYHFAEWGLGGIFALLHRPAPPFSGLLIFLVKMPGVLADILNAWLIFKILEFKISRRTAYRAALFYAFNPVTIMVSAIWGQMDAVLLSALLGATYFVVRGKITVGIVATAAAVMIKPQGLFFIPAIVATQWFRHPARKWTAGIGIGLVLGWLVTLPFTLASAKYPGLLGPVSFLWDKMLATAATYPHSSVNAFNLWAPTGMWKPDDRLFLGVQHRVVGLVLLGFMFAVTFWGAWKNRLSMTTGKMLLVFAIVLMGCFLLPTRMHERYLFPAVAFLALAAAANRNLRWNYWAFTATAMGNLLYAYFLYYSPGKWWDPWRSLLESGGGVMLVMANMWIFGDMIGTLVGGAAEPGERDWWKPYWHSVTKARDEALAKVWAIRDWAWMGGIAGVFVLLAVWNLFTPNEQIFDEVYHARTAKEFIDGVNPYEWTHPHLGKLLIAVGIMATHFDGFGWRVASLLFGALTLCAVYLLAHRMFDSRRVAILATCILALDGVFFVQSRVAMTNIYVVFFMMAGALALWEYFRRSNPPATVPASEAVLDSLEVTANTAPEGPVASAAVRLSSKLHPELFMLFWGVAIGCALASRWSALYAWGIGAGLIGLDWLLIKRFRWSILGSLTYIGRTLVYIVAVPVAFYLASYIPWILQKGGHTLAEILQLQKNMYGYHAHMTATHNYQSDWWTWPAMLRPTWYYFHDWKNGTISGIVAIGNPAIWWLYIPVMGLLTYLLWKHRDWRYGFLAAFGLGLWFAWGVEPRKLVFMHYLFEAIPFLAIALAVFVDRLLDKDETRQAATGYMAAIVILFAFFYPILAAIPVPWSFYGAHIWFKTWY